MRLKHTWAAGLAAIWIASGCGGGGSGPDRSTNPGNGGSGNNGGRIAFSSNRPQPTATPNSELYSVLPDGSDLRARTSDANIQFPPNDIEPAYSPDGSLLAFVTTRAGDPTPSGGETDNDAEIFIASSSGANQRALTNNRGQNNSDAARTLAVDAQPVFISNTRLAFVRNNRIYLGLASNAAELNNRQNESGQIFTINADGTGEAFLLNGVRPTVNRNGTRLAFVRDNQIFVANIDGTNVVQLTFDAATKTDPDFSPSSDRLTYAVFSAGGQSSIVTTRGLDPANLGVETVVPANATNLSPSWSPDGEQICFRQGAADDAAPSSILRVRARTGAVPFIVSSASGNANNDPEWGNSNQ